MFVLSQFYVSTAKNAEVKQECLKFGMSWEFKKRCIEDSQKNVDANTADTFWESR